jgi:formylglycine-generating enzyme required for sulfatase activity
LKAAKSSLFCLFISLIAFNLQASGLKISSLERVSSNKIAFVISWENTWNDSIGHDAVWIFAKVKTRDERYFKHLTWQNFYFENEKVSVKVSADGRGFFVNSKINADRAEAKIEAETDAFLLDKAGSLLLFGTEMVYVKEGAFWLGDGISSQKAFRDGAFGADSSRCLPFKINSEKSIQVGAQAGFLFGKVSEEYFPKGDIPEKFPKGYAGFYCMKYEISQEQYCAFLNTLPPTAQARRVEQSLFSPKGTFMMCSSPERNARNGIVLVRQPDFGNSAVFALDGNRNGVFEEADDGKGRACNFLSPEDILAFLDWAALRPMTEFEFEKICRGGHFPQKGDFAWGTAFANDAVNILNDGKSNEAVRERGEGNAGLASFNSGIEFPQIEGGLRCGFGGTETASRLQSGAAYFGAKEMSGNLWEQCVAPLAEGLLFTNSSGDGELDAEGNSEEFSPFLSAIVVRGGAWNSFIFEVGNFRDLSVSARFYADKRFSQRLNTLGGRGVRND